MQIERSRMALPADPEVWLSRKELASILPVSYETLCGWAKKRKGPPYRRLPGSGFVAYRSGDVRAWLEGGEAPVPTRGRAA